VPQALLIGVGWIESGADRRDHVGGMDPRLRCAHVERRRANARTDE